MRYVANPVEVEAHKIVEVGGKLPNGTIPLVLENRITVQATAEMCSRMVPKEGDYWVIQVSDGYVYLNPRDVFERKYMPYSAYVGRG